MICSFLSACGKLPTPQAVPQVVSTIDQIGWVGGRARIRSPRKALYTLEMAAAGTAASSVWVIDDEPEIHRCLPGDPVSSPQAFLLANPPGPYTCLRTVGHRSAATLLFHLQRLWESAEATGFGPSARLEGQRSLERRTTEAIARVMEAFWLANADTNGGCPECMATVLYSHEQPGLDKGGLDKDTPENVQRASGTGHESARKLRVLAHAWALPTRPQGGGARLDVLIAGSGRLLPGAKHSSWLRDRQHLDKLKTEAGAQEVVLSETRISREGSGRRLLLEGLTSNIFVVDEDGTVCTAPSGVLMGGMRQLCIEACALEGIPVRLDAPDIATAGRWQEAFLTGTGRILAPIATIVVADDKHIDGIRAQSDTGMSVPSLNLLGTRDTSTVRRDPTGSRTSDMVGSRICLPTTDREGGPSVAQVLRQRMVLALEKEAERLF